MSLANPEVDTAIVSVGLEHDADLGAGFNAPGIVDGRADKSTA